MTRSTKDSKNPMLLSPEELQKRPLVWGITPDDNDSKDRDDATWVQQDQKTGIITATISITDLSAYIEKGSPAERRAREVHWTKYHMYGIKGNNDNMLGREMAEQTASLLPKREHPAQSIIAKFDKNFNFVSAELQLTRCYISEHVPPEELSKRLQPDGEYRLWAQLAYQINKKILKSHNFDNEEEKYKKTGVAKSDINPDECITNTSKLVEIYMLFANHVNAEIRHKLGIPGLYRNHLNPQDKHNYDMGVYVEAKKGGRSKKPLLDLDIVGKQKSPNATRAFYSPELISHTVIKHKSYEHATSPIRRYPDLVNQLMVAAYLGNRKYPFNYTELKAIAHDCNVHSACEKDENKIQKKLEQQTDYKQILLDEDLPLPWSASEQSGLLQAALANKIQNETFRDSLVRRLKNSANTDPNRVTDKLLLQLVHALPENNDFWNPVRDATLEYIKENPERGVSLLHLSCLAHRDWNDYKIRERHANGYVGRHISVNIKGKSLSIPQISLDKTVGEANRVNVHSFWSHYMNNGLVPDSQTRMIIKEEDTAIPSGTWKGQNAETAFRQVAQELGWDFFYDNKLQRFSDIYEANIYVWDKKTSEPVITTTFQSSVKAHALRMAAFEMLSKAEEKEMIPEDFTLETPERKNSFTENMHSTLTIEASPLTENLSIQAPVRIAQPA